LLIVEQSTTRAMLTGGDMVLLRGGLVVMQGAARELVKADALKRAYFGYEE
jgi:branched-chain amino acid transport system ATP-binding protein